MSKLHAYYKCPCGAEFGDQTDHPQVEKLCIAHMGGQGGYIGGTPEYVKGREFPEGFADFLDQHPEITRPPGYELPVEEPVLDPAQVAETTEVVEEIVKKTRKKKSEE